MKQISYLLTMSTFQKRAAKRAVDPDTKEEVAGLKKPRLVIVIVKP